MRQVLGEIGSFLGIVLAVFFALLAA